jgi:hypothetical protein
MCVSSTLVFFESVVAFEAGDDFAFDTVAFAAEKRDCV